MSAQIWFTDKKLQTILIEGKEEKQESHEKLAHTELDKIGKR